MAIAQHPGLFQKVGDSIVMGIRKPPKLRNLICSKRSDSDLVNIVWAYAKLDVLHHDLFKAMRKSIVAPSDFSHSLRSTLHIAWSLMFS